MKIQRFMHRRNPAMRDLMDRWFDEMWDPMSFFDDDNRSVKIFSGMPRIDVSETDNEFIVEADIPGFNPDNMDVQINGNILSIRGKTEHEKEDKDKKYYRRERSYGEFYREIPLPTGLDPDKAESVFKNGTLKISIPKNGQKDSRKLKIRLD